MNYNPRNSIYDDEDVTDIHEHKPIAPINADKYEYGRVLFHPVILQLTRGLKIEYYAVPMDTQILKVAGMEVKCWRDSFSNVVYTPDDRLHNMQVAELTLHPEQPDRLSESEVVELV